MSEIISKIGAAKILHLWKLKECNDVHSGSCGFESTYWNSYWQVLSCTQCTTCSAAHCHFRAIAQQTFKMLSQKIAKTEEAL